MLQRLQRTHSLQSQYRSLLRLQRHLPSQLLPDLEEIGPLYGTQSAYNTGCDQQKLTYSDCRKNKYYFWNKATNKTTWKNPFPDAEAAPATDEQNASMAAIGDIVQATGPAANGAASSSTAKPAVANAQTSATPATAADFGGIDPDLAYLDPSLAGRAGGPSGASFQARFNARTGRFQGDPTMNPDRVSDVERAKRQNQFYFDYTNWEKTLGAQQEEANRKRAAGELVPEDEAKRRKPSAKEMAAIRERNKAKKDKRQKGWLLEP